MDLGSLLFDFALLLIVALIVAWPLVERKARREQEPGQADHLFVERAGILNALRDLDFDHATGKVAADDYSPQRAQLVARGVAVLRQLDALGALEREAGVAGAMERGAPTPLGLDDEIEQAVAARRRRSPDRPAPAWSSDSLRCPQCNAPAHAGDRFCPRCGIALVLACPACGGPGHLADRFCGHCGARLASELQTAAAVR